jgi:hypothetical protein
VICIAQLFGLFPYQNLHLKNPTGIKFKWKSFRIVYSAIFLIYMTVVVVLNTFKHFERGTIKASTINGIFFYGSSVVSCYLFHQMNWKRFTIELWKIENIFISDKYRHPPKTWSLRQKIYLCSGLGFVTSLLNQVFYAGAETEKVLYIIRECNWTNHNFLEDYIKEHLNHIFKVIPYNHFYGEFQMKFLNIFDA